MPDLGALVAIECKRCGQLIALTDGQTLVIGRVLVRCEAVAVLRCPCQFGRDWRPGAAREPLDEQQALSVG